MRLADINQKIDDLYTRSLACKYVSHYTLQCQYEKLMKERNLINFSEELSEQIEAHNDKTRNLESYIRSLKASNETLIRDIDFINECMELIDANDTRNLDGLVDIGEYFGTGPEGRDVTEELLVVYELYRMNPSKRTARNKVSLDKLCAILSEPLLSVPQSNFGLFTDPRKQLEAIINAGAIDELMVWLTRATQEEADFALRLAASGNISMECLSFLLLRAAPSAQHIKVNILSPGKPSGQIALHRAIQPETIMAFQMLLSRERNQSNDILRQLLVRDRDGFTPIDCIEKIEDEATKREFINIVRKALSKYQPIPELQLSIEELYYIEASLNDMAPRYQLAGFG